jgi:hypothetical protein
VPRLQQICERAVASQLVEPRTALQILAYAAVAGADELRRHCQHVAAANLDAVLLECASAGPVPRIPASDRREFSPLAMSWRGRRLGWLQAVL